MLKRISDLRVGVRVGAAMAVLLVLLCALATVAVTSMERERESAQAIARSRQLTQLAMQVKFRSADFNGWQTAYAFDVMRTVPDATSDTVGSRKTFLASADSFRKELAQLQSFGVDVDQGTEVTAISGLFDEFMKLDQQIVADYRTGVWADYLKANELVAVDEIEIFNKIAAKIDVLVADVEQESAATIATAETRADEGVFTTIVLAIAAFLAGFALTLLLVRSITRPLGKLRAGLAGIAGGDLTERIDNTRADELGEVARGFNQLAERTQELIGRVAARAEEVAGASHELTSVSGKLAETAGETSVEANSINATATEVSNMVTAMASASEQMRAAIDEITQNASRAADVATDGVRDTQTANEAVAALGDATAEIGAVVKLISSIAEQTNLLALNATIEAARAGESGKGFAVVAGEVKELAQQTATATEDIIRRIKAIEQGSAEATSAIHQIGQVVSSICDTQTVIAAAVEEQTATTAEMSRNVHETANAVVQIGNGIGGLATATEDTSSAASAAKRTAETLSEASADLRTLISAFRY
ncbi:methyl-accepting chemotaxis protein [Actinokineospora globicatena]|uniref:Methyl-accepting chemotaxis protein n=1 Tax=Actinokineospora globicatena TaxID=103729 RepID=A0A9W6QQF7_9PSEU|nr:methyl-accepting chemotaxis protein [Actinokineospora globicatena]GLW94256.1 hypothetical protein Aglo03_50720 [Actinokineospora globicatena]